MVKVHRTFRGFGLPVAVALPIVGASFIACGNSDGTSNGGSGGVAVGVSSSGGAAASASTGGTVGGPLGGASNVGGSAVSTGGAVGSVVGGKLAIGVEDHCAINSQGGLVCWNSSNFLSNRVGPYLAASAGSSTTCMLRSDQDDECRGSTTAHPGTDVFVAIRASSSHACAQRPDHTIVCWGEDYNGSVLQVTTEPVDSFSTGFKTCVTKVGSVPQCWGGGQGTPPNVELKNLQSTDEITCGVSLEGMVYCWGTEDFTSTTGGFVKAKMAFDLGDSWGCGQKTTNLLSCWGTTSPVTAAELANLTIADFDLSDDGVCVILTDGSVRCWGTDVGTPPADLRVF